MPLATVAGVAAALTSVVWARGAALVAWAGVVPTTGIAQVARRFAEVPGGTLPWPDGAPGRAAPRRAHGRRAAHRPRARRRGRRPTPCSPSAPRCVLAAALVPTRTVTWPPDGWRVVVCDVGQGDAIVLRSGPHRAVLVDAGPDPPLVDRCLSHLGVDTLDAVVLTHFHADHVDGLSGAVDGRTVGQLLVGPVREPAESADAGRPRGARTRHPGGGAARRRPAHHR